MMHYLLLNFNKIFNYIEKTRTFISLVHRVVVFAYFSPIQLMYGDEWGWRCFKNTIEPHSPINEWFLKKFVEQLNWLDFWFLIN